MIQSAQIVNRLIPTEENIIAIKGASKDDVGKAVLAARDAFQGEWHEFSATQRWKQLYRLAELIQRDRELIAAIDAWDNGKMSSVGTFLATFK